MSPILKLITSSITLFLICYSCGSQEQKPRQAGISWRQLQPVIFDTIKGNSTTITVDASNYLHLGKPYIFNRILNQSRIIGLGEPTHGSKESTLMNIAILKFLIQHNNLRHICFEGDIVGGITLNNYILGRSQKSTDYIASFAWLGIYDTDFVNFIDWLKIYNSKLSQQDKVQIYGLGYLYRAKAIEYIENYIKQVEPTFYDSVRIYYKELHTQLSWEESRYFFPTDYDSLTVITLKKNSASIVEHLEANKNIYYQKSDSLSFYNIMRLAVSIGFSLLLPDPRENAKLNELFNNTVISSESSEKMRGINQFLHQRHRDYCLYTNFQAVFKEIPDKDKIAVWGHNLHIGKRLEQMNKITMKRMGCWLKEKYGHQYITIGYIFYEGKVYTHIPTSGGVQSTVINVQIPPDNSIESMIHKFTTSSLFIDIQSLNKLLISQEPILMRCIGSQYFDFGKEFIPTYITNDFDALIYLQKMTPAK